MSKYQIAILVIVLAGFIVNAERLCEKLTASSSKTFALTETNGDYKLTVDVYGNDSVEVKFVGFFNSESITRRCNYLQITLALLGVSNELSIRVTNTYLFSSVEICTELQFIENMPEKGQGILVKAAIFLESSSIFTLIFLAIIMFPCCFFAVICLESYYSSARRKNSIR